LIKVIQHHSITLFITLHAYEHLLAISRTPGIEWRLIYTDCTTDVATIHIKVRLIILVILSDWSAKASSEIRAAAAHIVIAEKVVYTAGPLFGCITVNLRFLLVSSQTERGEVERL
jgi:hypothetical protein